LVLAAIMIALPTSFAFRQTFSTVALVGVTAILFGAVAYWSEKNRIQAAQVESLQTQAILAANSIAQPEWLIANEVDEQSRLLSTAWSSLEADGEQPPTVVIYTRLSKDKDYLIPVLNTSSREIDINSGREFARAKFEPTVMVEEVESRDGGGMAKLGTTLGAPWGNNRRIVATAPIKEPGNPVPLGAGADLGGRHAGGWFNQWLLLPPGRD